MNIPILPYDVATDLTVDAVFRTAVNESESGISGRKSLRQAPLRQYTMTAGPATAVETMNILLACRGARWPIAIRDWANNYKLTDEPQTYDFTTDSTVANLVRTFTPATGARSFSQRILIIDQSETSFSIKVNGSPLTSGISWSITDPGILSIGMLLTSGDELTVSGEYLVPTVFSDDAVTATVHRRDSDDYAGGLMSIQNFHLREILESELTALLGL